MTIPNLAKGAEQKGIRILGTGDATQPDWLDHIKKTLHQNDGYLEYDSTIFLPTVEFEDEESIHHVILLPNLESVDRLRNLVKSDSPNLDDEWGGRPRVNLGGEEIAGHVRDVGGMIGPAHAFTPFKAIFRENKHDSLESCYASETENIHFIELGLSADSETADYIPELRKLTYITSSDAHSPTPNKLGREFVQFVMKDPSFEELKKAIIRNGGRKPTLNLGFNPRLGKYFLSFCSSCRKTLVIKDGDAPPSFDELNVYFSCKNEEDARNLIDGIHRRKIFCPDCGKKMRLGVRDRARMIGELESKKPTHRPPYLYIPPLLDLISTAIGVKSTSSKSVRNLYGKIIESMGPESSVLTKGSIELLKEHDERLAKIVHAYRNGDVSYISGGGGRYGKIIAPWESQK
ncbi:MAG: phosphotransferase [Candidatus Lokiarchaeota archaeon]|nr:phosphotransferase [Candidatus Lokiarchaeota archaeon]